MKILVTGAGGQLGHDVIRFLETQELDYLGTTTDMMDITDKEEVFNVLLSYNPDVVVHCAAYTNVDKAEEEPDTCFLVNEYGTKNIAKACKQINAKLVYISTDYVFSGNGEDFYKTEDFTAPQNIYGLSKLAGEDCVKKYVDKYFIVRISWVFGSNGKNFVKTMIRLGRDNKIIKVVCDQIGSPTYTYDLAQLLVSMIQTEKYGVYHAHNEGTCSWAEFARTIFKFKQMDVIVEEVPTREYITKAVRPLNSRMETSALIKNGFMRLPPWKEALKRYLTEYGE